MRRYGLIGYPLVHSVSAAYFKAKLERENIKDAEYSSYEISSIDLLPQLLESIPELCGINVTIPYKQQIIPYLDELSCEARDVGAVNCVKRQGDRLVGYNTDIIGLSHSLARFLGSYTPNRALVLGTGGASQAVQYVLAQSGIEFALVSRDITKGDITYGDLSYDIIASHELIINTSPVGMYPNVDEAPQLPYAFVTPDHYLFDLIYNPPLTQFLDYGRQCGAHICNGEDMFVAQAEAAWEIWTNDV